MIFQPADLEKLARSINRHVAGDVYFEPYQRAFYSTDASMYRIQPLGVVVPRTAADAARTVALAAEHGVPVIPRGSGTSLSGQPLGAALIIDFSKYLNRVLEIDPESCTARVEPGVVLDQLNAAAARFGLQFGPDVATSDRANLGGMIGNNSAGARSILHGKTVDHVIALDCILSDATPVVLEAMTGAEAARRAQQGDRVGQIQSAIERLVAQERDEILARFPAVLRRVSGYNLDEFVPECRERIPAPCSVRRVRALEQEHLPAGALNLAKLVVGAEGTLAVVTGARLHLVPLPHERSLLVLEFASLPAAVEAVGKILPCEPSAIELFDRTIIDLAANSLEYRNYLDFVAGRPEYLLLAEFSGDSADSVQAAVADVSRQLRGHAGLTHTLVATEQKLRDHVWKCRKAALPLLMGMPGARKPIAFVEDTAVNPAKLPEFVERFRAILLAEGTGGAFYGHASVGCLHIRPLINTRDRADLLRMQRILERVSDLVLEFGGAMSGEHGDGLARGYLNKKLFGPRIYRAFQEVKRVFDPRNLFNPGKIVNSPAPTENLRLGPEYRVPTIATTFDFSAQGGLAAAAELCNGAGVCRKTQTGTMCPSFMATRDEEHSTRGRANALRTVLSGALPYENLSSEHLFRTFELCLQCKGCKAECPSNVDVAKLKSEFLSHYYQARHRPLGVRMIGRVAQLNRLGSALAPWSNWMAALPAARWMAEKLLGIDRRRTLPRFHRDHFRRWFARRAQIRLSPGETAPTAAESASRGTIVLLDDCLTSYQEPDVNRAAVAVLEAAGYQVELAGILCCGRPLISKGLLAEARTLAAQNISRLIGWAERGIPIVGCEPSCLLALVDDYRELVPGPAADRVAAAARLIDSHLVRERIELPLVAEAGEILLHGHCHQKALVGAGETQALLAGLPGASVTLVDSGCCGMAGSFGYEHYDLSMAIGERVLLPAIRACPGAAIVAPGISCRQQIADGTGRRAWHPIELVARHLLSTGPDAC